MLTENISNAFAGGVDKFTKQTGIRTILLNANNNRQVAPSLFHVTADQWLDNEALAEEVFGPAGLIVQSSDDGQMMELASSLHGQLTCTLHMDPEDLAAARRLMPILETKAGRLLANGYPTGVEVADAMVHSGPYPASTNFGATSVGTLSIRRFLRPVCYQNIPDELFADTVEAPVLG